MGNTSYFADIFSAIQVAILNTYLFQFEPNRTQYAPLFKPRQTFTREKIFELHFQR